MWPSRTSTTTSITYNSTVTTEVGGGQALPVDQHICMGTRSSGHLMVTSTEQALDTKVCVGLLLINVNYWNHDIFCFFSFFKDPHTVILELSRFSSHRDLTKSDPVRNSRRRHRDSHREIQSTISPRRLGGCHGCARCQASGAVCQHHHHHHHRPVVHSSAFHY